MTPSERLSAINDLISEFDKSASEVESGLMDRLASAAESLLTNPTNLAFVLRDWQPQWVKLIQDLASGILDVADLNREYFAAIDVSQSILSAAHGDLLTAIGVTGVGVVVEGGYIATLLRDTSVGRQLISILTDAKLRKLTPSNVVSKLKPLVQGKQSRGILGRLFDSLDTQPHVEVDRYIQRSVAIKADLRASLYLGGLIDSSRPFCEARNGKVFLVEEIERFGTSKDTYGGYSDRSTGFFSGKPKSGYDPFTMCGGVRCRHGWNYISNTEAIRRRDDLEEVKGVLRVKKS